MSDEEFKEVARRVEHLFDSIGRGPTEMSRAMKLALVEMVAVQARDGEIVGPEYVDHPAHLPSTNLELRTLRASTASKDATLRDDLVQWAEMNRQVETRHVANLLVSVQAHEYACELVDSSKDEEEARAPRGMIAEIDVTTNRAYQVDVREAPTGREEREQWAKAAIAGLNPCPRWLYSPNAHKGGADGRVFVPKRTGVARFKREDQRHLDVVEDDPRRKERDDDD